MSVASDFFNRWKARAPPGAPQPPTPPQLRKVVPPTTTSSSSSRSSSSSSSSSSSKSAAQIKTEADIQARLKLVAEIKARAIAAAKAKAKAKAEQDARTRAIAQAQQKQFMPLPLGVTPESKLGQVLTKASEKKRSSVSKPETETLTQQQYFHETFETKQAIGEQKASYYKMQESIDPTGMYRYQGVTLPGILLKSRLQKEYLPQLEKAEIQSSLAWSQARDLPSDTTIIKTEEGYEFKFRDTSLDWSKGEFKKIGKAPPGVSQVAEFGFGAVSSFGALLKPLVLDPLMGTEKSRASHFVSPFDVAFEPVGWSPKGSTELMAKHPIFTAGGVGAEVVQAYAMTQALKPVSAGVKAGGKFVGKTLIKKGASFYGKFTKVFPEEKFLSGGIKGTRTIVAKGGSELPENIYRWGAKGYQKGLELTSAGVKTSIKEVPGVADDITRNVLQKTKYGSGGVKRVWLSPEKYSKAEQEIAEKLGLGKVVEKSYRADIKAGVGTATELTEKTQFKLSWSGKRLLKKYGYTRQVWKVGDDVGLAKISSKGDDVYKGFSRFALEGADEPIKSSGWYAKVKDMYTYGYQRSTGGKVAIGKKLESGGQLITDIVDKPAPFVSGFGSSGTRPMAKSWITHYRTPFWQNIQGQASVSLQDFKTKLATKPSLKTGGRASLFSNLYTKTIPSSLYTSVFEPAFDIATIGSLKTLSRQAVKPKTRELTSIATRMKLEPDIMTLGGTRYDTLTILTDKQSRKPVHKTRQDQFTTPDMRQNIMSLSAMDQSTATGKKTSQASMVEMDLMTELVPIPEGFYGMDIPFKQPRRPMPTIKPVPSRGFFFHPLPKKLFGGGGGDFGFGFTTPISRKRKHKIGDLLAELGKGFDF